MWLFQFLQMNPHFPKFAHLWRSAMCKQKVKDNLIFRTIYSFFKMFKSIVRASSGSDMEEAYSAFKPRFRDGLSLIEQEFLKTPPTKNRCCLCCWNCSLRAPTSDSSWWAHYAPVEAIKVWCNYELVVTLFCLFCFLSSFFSFVTHNNFSYLTTSYDICLSFSLKQFFCLTDRDLSFPSNSTLFTTGCFIYF